MLPIEAGMDPEKWQFLIRKLVNDFRFPIEDGMVPENSVKAIFSSLKGLVLLNSGR